MHVAQEQSTDARSSSSAQNSTKKIDTRKGALALALLPLPAYPDRVPWTCILRGLNHSLLPVGDPNTIPGLDTIFASVATLPPVFATLLGALWRAHTCHPHSPLPHDQLLLWAPLASAACSPGLLHLLRCPRTLVASLFMNRLAAGLHVVLGALCQHMQMHPGYGLE